MKKIILAAAMLMATVGGFTLGTVSIAKADGGPILCPKKQPTCGQLPPMAR